MSKDAFRDLYIIIMMVGLWRPLFYTFYNPKNKVYSGLQSMNMKSQMFIASNKV